MLKYTLVRPEPAQRVIMEDFGQGQNIDSILLIPGFPLEEARIEQRGNDLVFRFEDAAELILPDFFEVFRDIPFPAFRVNGQEVTAEEALAAMMYAPVRHLAFHTYENAELDAPTEVVPMEEWGSEPDEFTGMDVGQVSGLEMFRTKVSGLSPNGTGLLLVTEADWNRIHLALHVSERGLTSVADTSETATLLPPAGMIFLGTQNGRFGTTVLNADGTISYTLNGPVDHTVNPDAADSIVVIVRAATGQEHEFLVPVTIEDDASALSLVAPVMFSLLAPSFEFMSEQETENSGWGFLFSATKNSDGAASEHMSPGFIGLSARALLELLDTNHNMQGDPMPLFQAGEAAHLHEEISLDPSVNFSYPDAANVDLLAAMSDDPLDVLLGAAPTTADGPVLLLGEMGLTAMAGHMPESVPAQAPSNEAEVLGQTGTVEESGGERGDWYVMAVAEHSQSADMDLIAQQLVLQNNH